MVSSSELHAALKTEISGRTSAQSVDFFLAKLQQSKNDVRFSLHAHPTGFSTAGLQTTDFLGYLGFRRQACPFVPTREAYCRAVPEGFSLREFGEAFDQGFRLMQDAERHLEACGFVLEQPEGFGYFFGKPSDSSRAGRRNQHRDGHTAPESQTLKNSEDESFQFALSFLSGGREKGWTLHYRPKHLPLSPEVVSALQFLDLKAFAECPIFDFEACFWRFETFQERDDHLFGGNADFVHRAFDAHPTHFSAGIRALAEAHGKLAGVGFGFLPAISASQASLRSKPKPSAAPSLARSSASRSDYQYDVAISFAGSERAQAEQLAALVRDSGFAVFYDDFYPEQLWGQDLVVFFDEVYRKQARYCVMFISSEYCSRMWTNHERRSAQARLLQERGQEYILPIKMDDAELPGMAPTLGYLDLRRYTIDQIADLLVRKLRQE